MNIFESIILGIIQGLTEFLPISSSGHLVLGQYFLGINLDGILLEVVLHLGTLFAILIYYKDDLKEIVLQAIQGNIDKQKYILYIIMASIPIGYIGLFHSGFIEGFFISSIVILALFINGLILASTFFLSNYSIRKLTFKIAFLIGIAQSFALVPGISRSGITISIALILGLKHIEAAKFSFFLAIPGLFGAGIIQIMNIENINNLPFVNLVLGFIFSSLVGYFVIDWLLKVISKGRFYYFSFYCIFLSIISSLYIH